MPAAPDPPVCGMTPSRARSASRSRSWDGSSPRARTVPLSAVRNPAQMSSVVVLPAPLRPSTAVMRPAGTVKVTPSRALRSPYRLLRFSTSSVGAGTRLSLGTRRHIETCAPMAAMCRFTTAATPGFDHREQLRDNVVVKNTAAPTLADRRTRERVAQLLLELGPSAASALGERLGLTPAAVRRHLDGMLATGTLVAREAPARAGRGRGRPAKLFALSDAGHAAGPTAYDAVAVSALRYLRETADEAAVENFARQRIAEWESRYAAKIASLPLDERPAALVEALCDDGYAATVHDGGVGVQVCQHHCPGQHVAEEFPALCEAETEAIGRLVGRHVQRLATIAHGDGVCTTHIPLIPLTPVTSGRTSS